MAYLLLYILITVASYISIHAACNAYPQELLILICTFGTIFFFTCVTYKNITTVYLKLFKQKSLYFLLLLSITVIWASTFLGIHYISPTFFMFIMMTIGALYGACANYIFSKKRIDFVILILVSICALFFLASIIVYYEIKQAIFLIVFSLVVGLFDYLYAKTSYVLSNKLLLSASEILASRFWLIFAITLTLVLSSQIAGHQNYLPYLFDYKFYWVTFLIMLSSFIVPIYCYQKSVLILGANDTLLYCAALPSLMYSAEKFFNIATKTSNSLGYITALLLLAVVLQFTKNYCFTRMR